MFWKKLKHHKYLDTYKNCPPSEYLRKELLAFRWVHKNKIDESFTPLNLIKEPPPRMLDKSDSMCMGYGLSMFNSEDNARQRYKKVFLSKRGLNKEDRVNEMGDAVAELRINKNDGISGNLNEETGHFTFHEYKNVALPRRIVRIDEIFDTNGEFKTNKHQS